MINNIIIGMNDASPAYRHMTRLWNFDYVMYSNQCSQPDNVSFKLISVSTEEKQNRGNFIIKASSEFKRIQLCTSN